MKSQRRKLSFQLTPLLDLLLIVIFAQFMEVQHTVKEESTEVARKIDAAEATRLETLAKLEVALQDVVQLETEQQRMQTATKRRESEINEELLQTRQEIQELGEILSRLFRLPRKTIERALAARTDAERTELRNEIESMAGRRAADMVKHLRTWRELLKRCDVWDIHLGDDNRVTLNAAGMTFHFRAETAERFEAELFARYKALPQPKSLVILLVSWADAEFGARQAVTKGIARSTQRMHEDSDRKTRFEYAVLGYTPSIQ